MGTLTVFGVAFGLSIDAFAASVANSCLSSKVEHRHVLLTALSFGLFQALMPILGWYAGNAVQGFLASWEHWIALGLLSVVGGKMLYDGIKKQFSGVCEDEENAFTLPFSRVLLLSVATSIDALVVGVSFSFLDIPIVLPAVIIGVVTFGMSSAGGFAAKALRHHLPDIAEIVGGVVLIALGIRMFLAQLL